MVREPLEEKWRWGNHDKQY